MTLIETIKRDIESSTRLRNQLASNVLKVVLSECQRSNDFSDQFVIKFCKKLIEANNETLSLGGKQDLSRENELLKVYVPTEATIDEIRSVASSLPLSNDKKSIGILIKACKEKGMSVNTEDIKTIIGEYK